MKLDFRALKMLVVDDNTQNVELIENYLKFLGSLTFHGETSPLKTIDWAKKNHFDIALIDYRMPEMNGIELTRSLMKISPDSIFIIMTGYSELEIVVEALRTGIFDFLSKPFKKEEFEIALERVIKHIELDRQNIALRGLLQDNYGKKLLIGNSPEMQAIRKKIALFAQSDAPVLITGETGVGKEVAARTIHTTSNRQKLPFVPVNCSAYVETLLESELFGHERGAFTGAERQRMGRLEFAQDGTLLLDEICEIPQQIQVKLLRVLQEKEFERVGGNNTIKLKARIISATNRNVQEELDNGRFRTDLYFRLNTLHIHMPPLRERKQDIDDLTEHMLSKFSLIHNKNVSSLSESAREAIHTHPLPGNVRQLENVIDYAILCCQDSQIEREHLPEELLEMVNVPVSIPSPVIKSEEQIPNDNIPEMISELERQRIKKCLNENKWNKSKTATKLGLTRAQLLYRMKKYGIN